MDDSTATYENQLEYCWQVSLNGCCDEQEGSVDELGWYGMLRFCDGDYSECPALKGHYGAILNQDSQGFKSLELYDNEQQLISAWYDVEQKYAAFYQESE